MSEVLPSGLRNRVGMTQREVAESMVTTQSAVARLETQADVRVSTLGRYVTALGGRLRLMAEFPTWEEEVTLPALAPRPRRRFHVLWQNPSTRAMVDVGRLVDTGTRYEFHYTQAARSDPAFTPFAGLPDLHEQYRSESLFTFFDERAGRAAGSPRELAESLGLTPREAQPVELLARSWGTSPHDATIQIVPHPTPTEDGRETVLFLAAGVRHVLAESPETREAALRSVRPGDELELRPEPDNEADPRALLVVVDDQPVAYVPAYLAAFLATERKAAQVTATAEHVNGPATASHLRLLCRLVIG